MIVNDLFIVKPMASFTGYLTYMQYALGTEKGGVGGRDADGNYKTVIQNESPFVWGKMTEDRERYTSERVVEKYNSVGATEDYILDWGPASNKKVEAFLNNAWVEINESLLVKNAAGEVIGIVKTAFADNTKIRYRYDNVIIPQDKLPTLVARMQGITLEAKARRIAVSYSQIAAYQA